MSLSDRRTESNDELRAGAQARSNDRWEIWYRLREYHTVRRHPELACEGVPFCFFLERFNKGYCPRLAVAL
jgi:hypothetical protein